MKLIVSGGWSYGNIGDEAIAEATIHLVNKFFGNYDVIYTSYKPEDFLKHHRINAMESFAKRYEQYLEKCSSKDMNESAFLKNEITTEYLKLFSAESVLLLSGGGYIVGNWDQQILAQIIHIEEAKKRGAYVCVLGQSIGPINNRELELRLSKAFNLVDFIMVRDKQSSDYLTRIGVSKKIYLNADLAVIISDVIKKDNLNGDYISIMPASYTKYQSIKRSNEEGVIKYLKKVINRVHIWNYKHEMTKLIKTLGESYYIKFVSSTDWEGDKKFIDYLINKTGINRYDVNLNLDITSLCKILSSGSLTISGKMHPIIISTSYGKPTVGISYNYKMDYFMESIGRGNYCIRVYSLNARMISDIVKNEYKACISQALIDEKKKEIINIFDILKMDINRWNDLR